MAISHTVFTRTRQLPWSAALGSCQASGGFSLHQSYAARGYRSAITSPTLSLTPPLPWPIKLSARKCPSLRFLPLVLDQHLSARQSVSRDVNAPSTVFTCSSRETPGKKKKSSSLLRQRFKLASGKKNSIIKELIAESPRGFPDPPSLATLLDKGLWVYLRKQSLGRGWSGLADRLVQPGPLPAC